jgi:HD-GYP domain-containing protein (c-di-GMP phosphodiesterase class II)
MSDSLPVVNVDQLQVGMFVSLDMPWMDHPFLVNSFRITSEKQLLTLRELGLGQIAYDPARSDAEPLPADLEHPAPPPPPLEPEDREQIEAKRQRAERMRMHRETIDSCEKAYGECVGSTKNLIGDILRDPGGATAQAGAMVATLASTFLCDEGATVMLVASRKRDDANHQHMLNVMILTMILAKGMGLNREVFEAAGMGALLHDIGTTRINPSVLRNKRRNRPEETLYRLHGEYGLQLVGEHVTPPVRAIIREHHECIDGSGFPAGRQGKQINPLARMVAIANRYDNLCNPHHLHDALTPAEALSQMYAREAGRFDGYMLAAFIKELGVYPPGSFVRLSTGSLAIVIAVTPGNTLKPTVLVYEPGVPRRDALVLSLAEAEGVTIEEVLKPSALPRPVVEYLNPRMNLAYFAHQAAD